MGKLTDVAIRNWIKAGELFEGRSDGEGLSLRYRERDSAPRWLFRYQMGGQARVLQLGSYRDLSLADARRTAKEMRARVALGFDVAAEKRERQQDAVAKIDAVRNAVTVSMLADQYLTARIIGRWKHPNIVRSRIERDIKPASCSDQELIEAVPATDSDEIGAVGLYLATRFALVAFDPSDHWT